MSKFIGAAALALAASTVHANAADQIGTVFVIALENHNATQPTTYTGAQALYGNPAAPYLNSLITAGNANAAQTAYAGNYRQVPVAAAGGTALHPSEPNYLWAEAGTAGTIRNDSDPYTSTGTPQNVLNAPSLSAELQASGQSWRSYQEDTELQTVNGQLTNMPVAPGQQVVPLKSFSGTSASYTNEYNGSNQYNYATKHNPMAFFTATNGGYDTTSSNPEAKYYAPLQQLAGDLANNTVAKYNWITPDQYNDMHTALSGGFTYKGVHYTGDAANIAQGDNFLSIIVPEIMASDAYKNNGMIVIWDDEAEGETAATTNQFTIPEIVISPLAKGNAYDSTTFMDHSSDLLTMQEIFGLTPQNGYQLLGDSANANDLSSMFKDGAIPQATGAVPEPASWAMLIAGFGLVGASARRRTRAAARAI